MKTKHELILPEILTKYGFLTPECVSAIEKLSRKECFTRKETIVPQDEKCDSLYFIAEGLVRVVFYAHSKQDTICFGSGGDVFMSFHALYGNKAAAFSLVSITDVMCYRLSNAHFNRLRNKHPCLERWFSNLLVEQLYSFEVLYQKLALASPEERFKNFWDYEADSLRNMPVPKLTRIVPLKIIAQYLGMTASTLSRLRRRITGR